MLYNLEYIVSKLKNRWINPIVLYYIKDNIWTDRKSDAFHFTNRDAAQIVARRYYAEIEEIVKERHA